jgi:hypothetical protein
MIETALRPRSPTEIIDAAFQLLRFHYTPLVAVTAMFVLPPLLLRLVMPEELAIIPNLLSRILQSGSTGAVILLVSDVYLGRPADVGSAMRRAINRLGAIFWASVMQGLIVGLGLLLLIVPGIIWGAWAFAMPMVVVVENLGASASFDRSKALARGEVWRILKTLVVTYLVFYLVVIAMIAVISAVAGDLSGRASDLVFGILSILFYPAVATVATLLYYDLRIRKEGFDLEVMAMALDGATAAPAAR